MADEGVRVLVAVDGSRIGNEVEAALRDAGFSVRVQSGGSGPVRHAESFDPHLVIIDVSGPEISFDHVLARLGLRPDLPSILLNGNDSLDHRLNSFRLGADDYLIKPIAADELVARVKALPWWVACSGGGAAGGDDPHSQRSYGACARRSVGPRRRGPTRARSDP